MCGDLGVGDQVEEKLREIMQKDIPPEAMEAGRRLREEQERLRQHLIAKYEEDGLMPHERGPLKLVSSDDD